MGTMNKMRENTGVILWILVFAFGVIWVLQDSGGLDAIGMGGANVILVDGDPISFEEYSRAVDAQIQAYQQQTGESMPPQMAEQQREFVFQQLVENKLLEHEMDRIGISVTDAEVYDMVMGPDPHPLIRMYFGDEEGNVNRALLQSFISDPAARQDWIQIENYLRDERRREKMNHLIAATVRVNSQDVLDDYRRRNLRVDAEWVGLRYADLPNDSVVVTDRDLRNFYNDNRQDYRRERTYTLRYVTRPKQPSPEDSAAIAAELTRLAPAFAEAEDDSLFLRRNFSERPYSNAWFAANDLDQDIAAAVFENPQPGHVVGPIFSGNLAHIVKIRDVRAGDETFVRARHILLRSPTEDDAIRDRLVGIRDQIAAGADFADMARRHSDDGSAANGGDLGWFGRGQMVEPFERGAFDAAVGEVVGPIQTQFGYHLIQVLGRTDREVQISDMALPVRADVATLNRMQEQLEDLRFYAEETGNFDAEATRLGLTVEQVQVEAGQQFLPGLGGSRAIMNFLETTRRGRISDVIELDDVFVVVRVDEIVSEGYRPFDEVRAELEPRVYVEKKKEVLSERLRRAIARTDFDGLPQALGIEKQTATGLSFNSSVIPGLGREPRFIGSALALEEGGTSGVVAGENAVYVIRVTAVHEPLPITDAERQRIREQLEQSRRSQVQNEWLTSLREKARVDDRRSRFLQ